MICSICQSEYDEVCHTCIISLEKCILCFQKFEIDEEVKQNISLPKLLIHSFVENAIKHGLRHIKKDGKLEIKAFKKNKSTIIIISDNGIGREKAMQYSSLSTGKGIGIVNQTLELYFKLKNVRIKYKITDLYNEAGNPTGTRVDILKPNRTPKNWV